MRRVIIYLWCFLYLHSTVDLQEILRTPLIIRHYIQTKNETKNLGFGTFLYMHYVGEDFNPLDDREDEKLPFKTHEHYLNSSTLYILSSGLLFKCVVRYNARFYTIKFTDCFQKHNFVSSIWHPPRIVLSTT